EREGEDWLRIEAAIDLVGVLGFHLQRQGEAALWQQVADALLVRLGDPDDLRGRWHYEVGATQLRHSELAAADASLHRALALLETVHGHDARELEKVLQRLGA